MKKKLMFAILLLFLFIIAAETGRAQVILKIIPPELNALKDSNQCNIQLINIGREQLKLMLSMDLKLDTNGSIYSAKSGPVILQAFESKSVSWDTLVISKNNHPLYSPSQKQILPGLYNLCLEAIEISNRKKIGNDCLQIHIEH